MGIRVVVQPQSEWRSWPDTAHSKYYVILVDDSKIVERVRDHFVYNIARAIITTVMQIMPITRPGR